MYKEEKKLNPSVLIDWLNKGKVDAKALFTYFDKEGKEIPYEERENAIQLISLYPLIYH